MKNLRRNPANGKTYSVEELRQWIGRRVEVRAVRGGSNEAEVLDVVAEPKRYGAYAGTTHTLLIRFEEEEEGEAVRQGAGWLPSDFKSWGAPC